MKRIKLSSVDTIRFFARLAHLQGAGLTLSDSLALMRGTSRIGKVARILYDRVRDGVSLSQGFVETKGIPQQLIYLIRIGEDRGVLVHVCKRLSDSLKSKLAFRKQVTASLVYPLLIMCVCVALVIGIFFFVVPRMLGIFTSMRLKLPLPTRVLIYSYSTIIGYWWVIITVFFFLVIAIVIVIKNSIVRMCFERVSLRIPLLGTMIQDGILADVFHSITLLLDAGSSLHDALDSTADTCMYRVVRSALHEIARHVLQGKTLSDQMRLYSYVFPEVSIDMITAGEASGSISTMSAHVGSLHEESLRDKMRTLSALIEPILMICIGVITGFVALALMMPLYQITSSLQVH